MAKVSLNIMDILPYLPVVQQLVDAEQQLRKAKSAASKRHAIGQLFLAAVGGASPAVAKNNPKYADLIGEFQTFMQKAVDKFAAGEPETVPPPPPATDPTAVFYSTLDLAKAAATDANPNVLLYHNGRYGVWPQLTPPKDAEIVWTKPAAPPEQ